MKCSLTHPTCLISLVLLAGCGIERGGTSNGSRNDGLPYDSAQDSADVDMGSEAPSDPVADASAELDIAAMADAGAPDPRDVVLGHYAERRAFRTIQSIESPLFNNDVKVLTTSYAVVTIEKRQGSFVFVERACHIDIVNQGSFLDLNVSIDDRVPRSMPEMQSELLLSLQAGEMRWERPETSVAVGWEPQSPTDALPVDAMDPRVRDTEKDGNPGVTAHVEAKLGPISGVSGKLYLVQWNRARYAGTRDDAGSLFGENFDTSSQQVIGADNDQLTSGTQVISRDPNTQDNRILLVRTSTPLDCDALMAQVETLFP